MTGVSRVRPLPRWRAHTQGGLGRAILLLSVPMMLEIPLASLLDLRAGRRDEGRVLVGVIAESLAGLVGIVRFRRGGWKQMQV